MVRERRLKTTRRMGFSFFIFMVTVVLSNGFIFAAERDGGSKPVRYRVFTLRHISAKQGSEFLTWAGLGTVSQLPGSEALLVTAEPAQLVKAGAILKLVDANEPFVIKAIYPASEVNSLPSNNRIEAELGDISIGTFSEPPVGAAAKAIIDVHNDAVVAVAPASRFENIIFAIEKLRSSSSVTYDLSPAQPATEGIKEAPQRQEEEVLVVPRAVPEAQDTNDSNELFGNLVKSPARAEERLTPPGVQAVGDEHRVETEPNLPVRQEQIKEYAAKDVPEKPEPEAKTGSTPEQVMARVDQPGRAEVNEPSAVGLSYTPQPLELGNEMLELDLPEKLNIIDLLDLVGKYLHLDYMYDDTKVRGEVSLKVQGPIKVKDLYPLLESVLKFRGFVMTRKGNLVTIVPAGEALEIDPALLDAEKGRLQYGDVVITRLFNLNYVDTTSAKNLLEGMKLGENIMPIPETGTLIVTSYAYRMARIEEVLRMIDKPGEPRQFRFRQLKYTMAKTLAPKIKTLVEQMGTISITVARAVEEPPSARRGPVRRPAQQRAPTPAEPAKPAVYLDADERTNRILMIGQEGELDTVEELIDTLDVAQQDLRLLRLYEIQHVGAEEVVKKLGELGIIGGGAEPSLRTRGAGRTAAPEAAGQPAAPGVPVVRTAGASGTVAEVLVEQPQVVIIESTNSLLVNATPEQHAVIAHVLAYVDSETLEEAIPYEIYSLENQNPEDLAEVLNKLIRETIQDKEGKIQQTIRKTEEEITIVPDENTFSIIVYASKKNQEWIGRLIRSLDKRRPQVLIDVSLVEITKSDLFQYDLDILQSFPDLTSTSRLTGGGTGGLLGGEPNGTNLVSRLLESGRDRFIDFRVTNGSGIGFYGDRHINALLTAMQTKEYGRILAKPKILVNDNEEGKIVAKDTKYVTKTSSVPITPVTGTTEIPTFQTSIDYAAYDAGITLNIKPHISEGDLLRLEIAMTRSDFVGALTADKPPNTKTSDLSTVVTVPNGSTIILGGLIKLNQGKAGSKVPLLGDIPLVGGLFRNVDNFVDDSRLYVFVKANILRPETTLAGLPELVNISDRNRAAFEKTEEEFQKHEDWPGIKPQPIEPLRVLEAE